MVRSADIAYLSQSIDNRLDNNLTLFVSARPVQFEVKERCTKHWEAKMAPAEACTNGKMPWAFDGS